jgi:hypothetical protein
MLLTIAFILLIMVALAALELRLFWQLGERDGRRRMREHATDDGVGPGAARPHPAAPKRPLSAAW